MIFDGGMINGYGSYGWIIANMKSLGKGETEGARDLTQSFQAEGYGMLATLQYILHAFTYTDNWRAALAVGSQVEASCLQTDADSLAKGVVPGTPVVRWYEAVVKEVDLGECALASALPCVSCASRCNCCC